jgi:hypothetical protein
VVWCYSPCKDPSGSVRHPCLVLAVAHDKDAHPYLVVAGGSSTHDKQGRARKIYLTELVCEKGLVEFQAKTLHPTKFSFHPDDVHILPYTRDSFYVEHGQAWPKVGSVDLSGSTIVKRLAQIGRYTDIVATIKLRLAELASKDVPVVEEKSKGAQDGDEERRA